MKPHGEFRIEVSNSVVHVFPSDGFNAEGINLLQEEIMMKAPKNGSWALFEHPCNNSGLTPDAVDAIIRSYKRFETMNCVAIALEISSTWKGIFEKSVVGNLNVPVFLGSKREELELQISAALIQANSRGM